MEHLHTYGLASLGAAHGVWKYYGPQTPAGKAWAAIGAGVVAYELACPKGETLSEGVDRALETRQWLTTAAIGVTALHLINALPEKIDPFSRVLKFLKEVT